MIKEYKYRDFNKVKFYYGIVNEVLEHYNVRFRIPDIIDNLDDDEYPIAHPILKHTSEVFKNDTIIIMQLDTDMQEFVYFSNDVTEFTGLRFGKDIIDLSLGKEEHPELIIKVAQLKAKDKDNNDLDEGEEYTVMGPYSEIKLTDEQISIKKAVPDDKDEGNDVKTSETIITDTDITTTIYKKDDDKTKIIEINMTNEGDITSKSTPSQTATSTITQDKDGNFKLESTPNVAAAASVVTDGGDLTVTAKQATAGAGSEIAMKGGTTTITADGGLKATATIDGAKGINQKHDLGGEIDIGALIEAKNMVGGLKGSLDDIWTELTTLTQNLITWAGMVAAITFVGPGSTVNTSGGGIGLLASSLATQNAKKALVNATFK